MHDRLNNRFNVLIIDGDTLDHDMIFASWGVCTRAEAASRDRGSDQYASTICCISTVRNSVLLELRLRSSSRFRVMCVGLAWASVWY